MKTEKLFILEIKVLAIISKHKIITSKSEFITKKEELNTRSRSNESRAYLECKIGINDKKLTVGTTHCLLYLNKTLRPQIILGRKRLLDLIAKHKSSYIFTGDLNVLPNDKLIRNLEVKLNHVGPSYNILTNPTKTKTANL